MSDIDISKQTGIAKDVLTAKAKTNQMRNLLISLMIEDVMNGNRLK